MPGLAVSRNLPGGGGDRSGPVHLISTLRIDRGTLHPGGELPGSSAGRRGILRLQVSGKPDGEVYSRTIIKAPGQEIRKA